MKQIWFLLSLVVFSSCSKKGADDDSKVVDNPCDRITEVLSFHPYGNPLYQTTATFTYDVQGRVKSVKGEGRNVIEYTYYNDRIVLKAKDIFGTDISQVYYLDKAKRIVREEGFDSDFKYDAEGFLTSYRQPYGMNGQITGYTQYYLKYQNGNLQEVYTNDPNVGRKSVTFTYYDEAHQEMMGYNSPLYLSSVIYDRNTFFLIKAGFFGKQSKNLLRSVDHHQGYPAGEIQYTKDTKGRVTNTREGYSFVYQCP